MFTGFTPETMDFLWGIRMNNNRDWFTQHKSDYVRTLYEPMKELGQAVFQPFLERPGNLLKVSRIYRDARMHPPTPYKESLWLCIRRDVDWWAENPCLYFELNPEGANYGFFYWKPRTSMLEDFRRNISAKPDDFLKLISDTEAAVGQPSRPSATSGQSPRTIRRLSPTSPGRGRSAAPGKSPPATGCSALSWKMRFPASLRL